MLRVVRWTVTLSLGVVAGQTLAAQELARICASAGKVTVGQWATYAGAGGQVDREALRLAIVGSERQGDSTLYWFEVNHQGAGGAGRGEIWQLLVPGLGLGATEVRGLIVKLGTAPAMRVDQMLPLMTGQMGQTNPALEFARRCASARALGWETVNVPGGTVRALHARDAEGWEAWVSEDVPFAFVKLRTGDGGVLVLTGRGTDAKSSITDQGPGLLLPRP